MPRVKLLARLAGALRDQPSPRPVTSISREAVEMARRLGEPGTLAYALDSVYAGLTYPQQIAEWRTAADQLVQAAEAADDHERAFAGHQHRVGVLMLGGAISNAPTTSYGRWSGSSTSSDSPLRYGRSPSRRRPAPCSPVGFQEAEAFIERNRQVGRRAQTADVTYFGSQVVQLFVLRREQGRLDEVRPALERFVDDYPGLLVFRCALAALHSEMGRRADARLAFEALASDDFADLPLKQEWFFGAGLLAEVCAALSDRSRAATLYELLLPYEDFNQLKYPEICCGSTSRQLGLLATTMSRWQDAERHFETAIESNRRTGARPWLAHAQADHARMLQARGHAGDRESAVDLIALARTTYRELGMHVHAERLTSLVDTRPPRATDR